MKVRNAVESHCKHTTLYNEHAAVNNRMGWNCVITRNGQITTNHRHHS